MQNVKARVRFHSRGLSAEAYLHLAKAQLMSLIPLLRTDSAVHCHAAHCSGARLSCLKMPALRVSLPSFLLTKATVPRFTRLAGCCHRTQPRPPPVLFDDLPHVGLLASSSQLRSTRRELRKVDGSPVAQSRVSHYSEQAPEPTEPQETSHISEHEYQVRVGKACRVIVQTLPDFMDRGVVDLNDLVPSPPHQDSSSSKRKYTRKLPFFNRSTLKTLIWGTHSEPKKLTTDSFESLYHPSIAFEFRPPIPHIGLGNSNEASDQFGTETQDDIAGNDPHRGGATICFSGRTVYTASAHILRHALSALFYDITLHLESARFEGRPGTAKSWSDINSYLRRQSATSLTRKNETTLGADRLVVRLRFEGTSRVTLQPHTYTVIFKYDFDRKTGTIGRHIVDNIQPIPGSKVWAGLTTAWGAFSPAGAGKSGAASYQGHLTPKEISRRQG